MNKINPCQPALSKKVIPFELEGIRNLEQAGCWVAVNDFSFVVTANPSYMNDDIAGKDLERLGNIDYIDLSQSATIKIRIKRRMF